MLLESAGVRTHRKLIPWFGPTYQSSECMIDRFSLCEVNVFGESVEIRTYALLILLSLQPSFSIQNPCSIAQPIEGVGFTIGAGGGI